MQTHSSNLRPSVRDEITDNLGTAPVDTAVSTPNRPAPTNAWEALTALMARIDWRKAYQYATNTGALAFLSFYAFDFTNIAADGNHIYTVYRLFPVLASTGIVFSMWTLPKESLLRVFYLVGDFTVSWLV